MKDVSRNERPSISKKDINVELVRQHVCSDKIKNFSVWKIINEDLGKEKVGAKIVPRLLNDDPKEQRILVSSNFFKLNKTTFIELSLVFFVYDPDNKYQNS